MKAITFALLVALAAAGTALADNDVGCGVGTQIFKGQKGLAPKLGASCTNGLTFQSVSITFGVLGCNGRDTVTGDAELRKFASGSFDRLARDMANGGGETLAAFSLLLGVRLADQPEFFAFTQAHFGDLFPSDGTTAGEMLSSLNRLLAQDARLSAYSRG